MTDDHLLMLLRNTLANERAIPNARDLLPQVIEALTATPSDDATALLCEARDALLTKRDYLQDAASGHLVYEDSGEGFAAMAKEDLANADALVARIDAALAKGGAA